MKKNTCLYFCILAILFCGCNTQNAINNDKHLLWKQYIKYCDTYDTVNINKDLSNLYNDTVIRHELIINKTKYERYDTLILFCIK